MAFCIKDVQTRVVNGGCRIEYCREFDAIILKFVAARRLRRLELISSGAVRLDCRVVPPDSPSFTRRNTG